MAEIEFYELFEIPKVEYETPGRDVDEDGDVCSWYVEENYPYIDDAVLINMICLLGKIQGTTFEELENNVIQQIIDKYNILKECGEESAQQFKEKVQNCFI